jgi:hypothetical protein
MASSRRTYDTDSITLRTVFAKNPGNSNVPALRVLTADGTGGTYWAIPSTLGMNPSFNEIITSAATYTADLSYNRFRLLAGENIGMVNGSAGSNQTTLFAKAFSRLDISGENSVYAFLNNQLDPSVTFAGENGIQLRADTATNTFFIGASGTSNTIISTGIYGFNQIKVTPSASTITSSVQGWEGEFLTATSPSTLLRFLGYNDIQLSTNITTNSVFFTISTFTSEGYLNISNAAFSAYPSTLSTVSSLYVQTDIFNSTINSFSTTSGTSFSSVQSSILALALSTGEQFYTLTGLINARATIVQLNTEIATVNSNLRSTVEGLGSAGYISTPGGGSGDVTKLNLVSTVEGLATYGYLSSMIAPFASTVFFSTGTTQTSSIQFLDTQTQEIQLLAVKNSQLQLNGTAIAGDVTKNDLVSTVEGLGTFGYISSLSSLTISTLFNTGSISTYSLEVYGSNTLTNSGSTILRGAIYLEGPTYVAGQITGASNTIATSSDLVSSIQGIGTIGYLSTLSSLYLSTGNLKTQNIETSTVSFKDTVNGELKLLNSSNNALYFNGTLVGSGSIINNFITNVYQVSTVSTLTANDNVVISTALNVLLNPDYFSSLTFSTGALRVSTVEFVDTQTQAIQLLAVKDGQLQLNGAAIAGDVTSSNLVSTVQGLGTSQYISTSALVSTVVNLGSLGYISTPSLVSTINGSLSTFSTALGPLTGGGGGGITTANLISTVQGLATYGYISSLSLNSTIVGLGTSRYVSTLSLNSTVLGLGTYGYISTQSLQSTVRGLGQTYVSTLSTFSTLLGANFNTNTLFASNATMSNLTVSTLTFNTGDGFIDFPDIRALSMSTFLINTSTINVGALVSTQGLEVSSVNGGIPINLSNMTSTIVGLGTLGYISSGGGGGGITTADLTSTVAGLEYITVVSTNAIVLSTSMSNYALTASTSLVTSQPNLWMNNRIYGTYNPVSVTVSTMLDEDARFFAEDIGKFFLFTQTNSARTISMPYDGAQALEGWNVVFKNMTDSTYNLTVDTTPNAVIAPGVATTIVCNGIAFYSI